MRQNFFNLVVNTSGQRLYEITDQTIEWIEKNNFTKAKSIDVVFVLEDEFNEEKAIEGKKYAIIKPVKTGISGENYYSIENGVKVGDIIVTGGY